MVLGELPVPGRPTTWITVEQGPTALGVGADGGGLNIFTLIYPFSPPSPSLWETARYRLKYCLKGPLNPKQPANQSLSRLLLSQITAYLEEKIGSLFKHRSLTSGNKIWWIRGEIVLPIPTIFSIYF